MRELDVCPFCDKAVRGEPEFCPRCGKRLSMKKPWWDVAGSEAAQRLSCFVLGIGCIIVGLWVMFGTGSPKSVADKGIGAVVLGVVFLALGFRTIRKI